MVNMKKIKKIFSKRMLFFLIDNIKSMIAFIISKMINTKYKNSWIICERKDEARDNGYHLYKFIINNCPVQNVFYIINKNSYDIDKIRKISKNIIYFGTIKHWIALYSADALISTHINGYIPNELVYKYTSKLLKIKGKKVFLQHGIIKDNLPQLYYEKTKLNLFICGAYPEYQYIKKKFNYPQKVVKYTGLCRFDNLKISEIKRQILVMPTFRIDFFVHPDEIISNSKMEYFKNSEYYKQYNSLLNDKELNEILKQQNVTIIFYPHYEMQRYISCFNNSKLSNILIAKSNEKDIQELLKESSLLITDFSSVFFDFAYMKKPMIYFQFDYNEYRNKHYLEGYFSYKDNGFGPVIVNYEKLKSTIIHYVINDFIMEKKYKNRVNSFFKFQDCNNCKRNYDEIRRIVK